MSLHCQFLMVSRHPDESRDLDAPAGGDPDFRRDDGESVHKPHLHRHLARDMRVRLIAEDLEILIFIGIDRGRMPFEVETGQRIGIARQLQPHLIHVEIGRASGRERGCPYEMRISDWSSDVCSSDLPTKVGILTLRLVEIPTFVGMTGRVFISRTYTATSPAICGCA